MHVEIVATAYIAFIQTSWHLLSSCPSPRGEPHAVSNAHHSLSCLNNLLTPLSYRKTAAVLAN